MRSDCHQQNNHYAVEKHVMNAGKWGSTNFLNGSYKDGWKLLHVMPVSGGEPNEVFLIWEHNDHN